MSNLLPPAERRSSVLVALYAALSLLLLLAGDRLPTGWLRATGSFLFEPFDRVVLAGDRFVSAWQENNELHRQITEFELTAGRARELEAENQHLRGDLGLPEWRSIGLKPVEVISLSGDGTPIAATLSAGEREGVQVGDAVITARGLVGRISEVYPALSRATLLTDENQAIACVVESTGVNGILRFSGAPFPRVLLTAVPLSDTIRVGQAVLTSGLSLRFPRGIPVGRVVRVGRDPTGLMQEVEVVPYARWSRLRHAFIAPRPQGPANVAALPTYVPVLELELRSRRALERAAHARRDSLRLLPGDTLATGSSGAPSAARPPTPFVTPGPTRRATPPPERAPGPVANSLRSARTHLDSTRILIRILRERAARRRDSL